MKKHLLLFILLLIAGKLQAQPQERRAELKTVKIGFITSELQLTEAEGQKFFPIYQRYEAEKEAHRKKLAAEMKNTKINFDALNDAEVEASIEVYFALRQQEVDIEKKYYAEFKKVLPIQKVARFYAAEKKFQREVLRSLRDQRPPRQQGFRR